MNLLVKNYHIKLAPPPPHPLEIRGKHSLCFSFLKNHFLFLLVKSCKSYQHQVLPNETSHCADLQLKNILNIKAKISCFKLLAYFEPCREYFLQKPHHKKLFFLLNLLWGILCAFSLNAVPRPSLENCLQTNSYFIKQPEPVNPLINADEIQMGSQKKLEIISSSIKGDRKQHIKTYHNTYYRETLENITVLNYKGYVKNKIWVPPEC